VEIYYSSKKISADEPREKTNPRKSAPFTRENQREKLAEKFPAD